MDVNSNIVFVAMFSDGRLDTSVWDFFHVERLVHREDTVDVDAAVIRIRERFEESCPATTEIIVVLDSPVRDGVMRGDDSVRMADIVGGLMPYSVHIANVDDLLAMASWENIGMGMGSWPDKSLWAHSSRLLHVGLHRRGIGISLVEAGRVITGLSYRGDDTYSQQLSVVNYGKSPRYYLWILRDFLEHASLLWSPDMISVVPFMEPAEADMVLAGVSSDKVTSPLLDSEYYSTVAEWVGVGASLTEQKDLIGDTPVFIRNDSAVQDDGIVEMRLG